MPRKNKQTEMPENENENENTISKEVVDFVEEKSPEINEQLMITTDNITGVYTVDVVERMTCRFNARTRKDALAIIKDMQFLDSDNTEMINYSHDVRKATLKLEGYKIVE